LASAPNHCPPAETIKPHDTPNRPPDQLQIVDAAARNLDIDVAGVPITTVLCGTPSEDVLPPLMLRFEDEGELSQGAMERLLSCTLTLNGTAYVVAAVLAATGKSFKTIF
jgi:hypothetical protein